MRTLAPTAAVTLLVFHTMLCHAAAIDGGAAVPPLEAPLNPSVPNAVPANLSSISIVFPDQSMLRLAEDDLSVLGDDPRAKLSAVRETERRCGAGELFFPAPKTAGAEEFSAAPFKRQSVRKIVDDVLSHFSINRLETVPPEETASVSNLLAKPAIVTDETVHAAEAKAIDLYRSGAPEQEQAAARRSFIDLAEAKTSALTDTEIASRLDEWIERMLSRPGHSYLPGLGTPDDYPVRGVQDLAADYLQDQKENSALRNVVANVMTAVASLQAGIADDEDDLRQLLKKTRDAIALDEFRKRLASGLWTLFPNAATNSYYRWAASAEDPHHEIVLNRKNRENLSHEKVSGNPPAPVPQTHFNSPYSAKYGDPHILVHRVADSLAGSMDWVGFFEPLAGSKNSIQDQWMSRLRDGMLWTTNATWQEGNPYRENIRQSISVWIAVDPTYGFFSPGNKKHQKLWREWITKNAGLPNRFSKEQTDRLRAKRWTGLDDAVIPYHSEFYRQYRLAGIRWNYNPYQSPESSPNEGIAWNLLNIDAVLSLHLKAPSKLLHPALQKDLEAAGKAIYDRAYYPR